MIKYLLALIGLVGLIDFGLSQTPVSSSESKPLVVSTASIFADMVEVIGGDLVESRSIVPLGGDPHTFEPTPEAANLVSKADLILMNGLTFEGWLSELIKFSGTKSPVYRITKGIKAKGSATYEGSEDPHAWMSAPNGLIYIENTYLALSKTFPQYQDEFAFNYKIYRQQLLDIDKWIRDTISIIPPAHRVLITSHDAFQYFGAEYGLKLESILGTSSDADVQANDVARVIKAIKTLGVPAVFIESTINPKQLEQIATDAGIIIGGKLFSDSLGDEQSLAPTYLDMLKANTRIIVSGLTAKDIVKAAQFSTKEDDSILILVSTLSVVFAVSFFVMFKYAQKS